MAGSIAISLGAILLGVVLIYGSKYLRGAFEIIGSSQYNILFIASGFVLIALGVIFLIYSIMIKIVFREKKKPEREEPERYEIYVCPFCGDKLTSKEALDNHIEKYHKSEKEIGEKEKEEQEKVKKVPVEPDYKYLP